MNKNINLKLSVQKGLITENNTSLYQKIENIYKYLFERYILQNINLKSLDEQINNCNLDFGISKPTKKQLSTNLEEYLNLNYFYLINNFFIEKLSQEDIELLKTKSIPNIELINLIQRTYKEIIKDNYLDNTYKQERYQICYGNVIPSNFAYNDEVVLKLLYGRNTKQLSDTEFIENIKQKKEYLNNLEKIITQEFKTKLDMDCKVIIEKLPN